MSNALKTCYGWLAFPAMALGLALGVVLVLAVVVGGPTAVALSAFAAAFIPWCIGVAAAATLVGLAQMYIGREHALTVSGGAGHGAERDEPVDRTA